MATLIGNISVPKNAYSIFDIAKFEKIRPEQLKQMMEMTLNNIQNLSPVKTPTGLIRYFNCIGRYDNVTNQFFTHRALIPIAKGIKITIEQSFRNDKLKKCFYVSFFIPKSDYELWKKQGIPYTEKPLAEVKENIGIAAVKRVGAFLPGNDTVNHFKQTVIALGYEFPEAICLAIDYFMKNNKDIFGTDYKKPVPESMIPENKTALVQVYINPELKNKIWKMIHRYNAVNFPAIKFTDFVESALAEKLAITPVQYTNPKLFEEYQKMLNENKQLEQELKETEGNSLWQERLTMKYP
jgi:hypothetical protein